MAADMATQITPRRINITKRPDFDGYGFNLHAEKGKPGQYIGKVDPDSPAEHAGLRQGDRILEVNGVDIGSETHKQVVERIKSVPNETTLLVLAPSSHTNGTSNGNGVMANGEHVNNNSAKVNGSGDVTPTSDDADMNGKKMSNGSSNGEISINNNETGKVQAANNVENNHNISNKNSTGLQLNLNMTAAEMRAMLQAKKKRDPKNESIDLRKKHDIIEKL